MYVLAEYIDGTEGELGGGGGEYSERLLDKCNMITREEAETQGKEANLTNM